MRIAVTGASGNVGTALLRRLVGTSTEVVGLCRRVPDDPAATGARVRWESVDVAGSGAVQRLTEVFSGVDAVVHAAWMIQPSRRPEEMARTNLHGSRAVVEAVLRAGVPHLLHLSSVGAYSTHPSDDLRVDEAWATRGIAGSQYSQEKAAVEAHLDDVERAHPELVVTRVRPALVFQRDAGSEIARYFLGGLAPARLVRRLPLPAVPLPRGLRLQVVHADDLADALARALDRVPGGALNVADEPLLTGRDVARALRASRAVPVDRRVARAAVAASYRARVHPVHPGWLDLLLGVPVMDTSRARHVLGWEPRRTAQDALAELLDGLAEHASGPSAALRPRGALHSRRGV